MGKIRTRPRGYPCLSAAENQGIRRKIVCYACQVRHIYTESSWQPIEELDK